MIKRIFYIFILRVIYSLVIKQLSLFTELSTEISPQPLSKVVKDPTFRSFLFVSVYA